MKSIDELRDEGGELNNKAIMEIIPYEPPFLMIDRVLSLDKNEIVAIWDAMGSEAFFKGHFSGFPIMPGALILEGMGQAATLLLRYNIQNHWEKEILAYRLRELKFSSPAYPGDRLRYEIVLIGQNDRCGSISAKAFIGDKQIAECQMALAIVDRKEFRAKASH